MASQGARLMVPAAPLPQALQTSARDSLQRFSECVAWRRASRPSPHCGLPGCGRAAAREGARFRSRAVGGAPQGVKRNDDGVASSAGSAHSTQRRCSGPQHAATAAKRRVALVPHLCSHGCHARSGVPIGGLGPLQLCLRRCQLFSQRGIGPLRRLSLHICAAVQGWTYDSRRTAGGQGRARMMPWRKRSRIGKHAGHKAAAW